MQQVAATLPALRAASTGAPERGDNRETMTLPGTSDAVAAADLQERIQKMAATAGTSLTAVRNSSASLQRGNGTRLRCGSARTHLGRC